MLYSTGNNIQYPMIDHNGKEYLKKNVCVYIYMCVGVGVGVCGCVCVLSDSL